MKSVGTELGFVGYATSVKPFNSTDFFINKGVLSNKKLDVSGQTEQFYTTDAISTGGFSGGAVFLAKSGKVIGLVKGGSFDKDGRPGITFIPPIHEVPELISQVEKKP